ncbi:hypothetical protein [Hamadaea tsunoensis]|uniref:hypothetical protein n=1 Tax=Hamadaea tsunoensis TaxID=53368 RepID=UPI00040FB9DA|nr:hypothetical protein [Hamadaea tsunoensis]
MIAAAVGFARRHTHVGCLRLTETGRALGRLVLADRHRCRDRPPVIAAVIARLSSLT